MGERQVSGKIEAVGWLEGSSGRLTGDIEGLYDGYRVGNPPVQSGRLELENGSIALELRHHWNIPLPPRPAVHALAGSRTIQDFVLERRALMKPSPGTQPGSPGVAFQGSFRTSITLHVDPAKSTGIFAGATGEIAVDVPAHKESGYLVVNTEKGNLTMTFLEWPEGTKLIVQLSVDGSKSTGVYRNARGTLKFEMDRLAIGVAAGSYSGALDLDGSAG